MPDEPHPDEELPDDARPPSVADTARRYMQSRGIEEPQPDEEPQSDEPNPDESQPSLAPIRGAPPGAPNLPFPTGAEPSFDRSTSKPTLTAVVTEPDQLHRVYSLMSPNAIAIAMEENRKRARFGAKLALEAMIANGKLLKMLRDEFNYRGSAYEDFAMAHADIHNKGDAHRLYLLGTYGDVVLAQCEAEEALVSNYEWPHWRKVVRDLKREADKREKHRDDVDTSPEPEQPAPESPLDAKTRECDELQAQLTAAAQQIRSERFAKEEAQEAYDKLAAKANATILGINAARAALPGWWKEREGRLQAYEPDEGTSP